MCESVGVCSVSYLHREIILKIGTIFGLARFTFYATAVLPLFLNDSLLKCFCYRGVGEVLLWSGETEILKGFVSPSAAVPMGPGTSKTAQGLQLLLYRSSSSFQDGLQKFLVFFFFFLSSSNTFILHKKINPLLCIVFSDITGEMVEAPGFWKIQVEIQKEYVFFAGQKQ